MTLTTSAASSAPAASSPAGPAPKVRGRTGRHLPSLVVLVVGLLITGALAWTCWVVNDRNETRLLRTQVQEGAAAVSLALPNAETPLASAIDIAQATGGSAAKFSAYMAPDVGPGKTYASASLIQVTPVIRRLALVGQAPLLSPTSPPVARVLAVAERTPEVSVTGLFGGTQRRLGYAFAGPASPYAVYAEIALPSKNHLKVASNTAFSDLDFALYLGRTPTPGHLLGATDVTMLPLHGRTASTVIPFGDTAILLVATPAGELGGGLLNNLVWIVATAGVILTLLATWITERLVRDRRWAEQLATENRALYGQQRSIAQTLQRALLPEELPPIAGLEVGVRYLPGVEGIDVGGDWCDVVELEPARCLLVVGDVSGRGLQAATTMASLHYSIRAYAAEGDSPSAILTKLSRLVRVEVDGQYASVLCGIVDVDRHRVTFANAGHLPPLLVVDDRQDFLEIGTAPPIGVLNGKAYTDITVDLPPRSTLLAFTDGLVERRGESIDEGLARLRVAAQCSSTSLEGCLSGLVDTMVVPEARDDTAILGLRWTT